MSHSAGTQLKASCPPSETDGGSVRFVAIQRNPRSGSGRGRGELLKLVLELRRLGYRIRMFKSRELLDRWVRSKKVGRIIAAGGDGTLADVLNRHPHATLFPFPLGTENLMARYVGIPRCGVSAAAIFHGSHVVSFDTAVANDRRFLLMLSAGVDAEVVHQLHSRRTGNIRHLSYVVPILRALLGYRGQLVTVESADKSGTGDHADANFSHCYTGGHLIISNVAAYGFRLPFCPQSQPHDGMLDVRVFSGQSRLAVCLHAISLCLRLPWREWGVKRFRASRICIRSHKSLATVEEKHAVHPNNRQFGIPVQCDGDPCGRLDLAPAPPGRSVETHVGPSNASMDTQTEWSGSRSETGAPAVSITVDVARNSMQLLVPQQYFQAFIDGQQ